MKSARLIVTCAWLGMVCVLRAQDHPRHHPTSPGRIHEGDLPAEQRAELEKRLNERWQALPLNEKLQAMRFHRGLSAMNPEEQRFVRERFERFIHMTDREREQLRANRERWRAMSPEERDRARHAYWRRQQELQRRWQEQHPGQPPPPAGRWPGRDIFPHQMGDGLPPPDAPPVKPNNQEKK